MKTLSLAWIGVPRVCFVFIACLLAHSTAVLLAIYLLTLTTAVLTCSPAAVVKTIHVALATVTTKMSSHASSVAVPPGLPPLLVSGAMHLSRPLKLGAPAATFVYLVVKVIPQKKTFLMNFFETFPQCSTPSIVSKKTIKVTGHHSRLRDMMGQSYPIYACSRANHAHYSSVHVKFCSSSKHTLLK